ncbi:hypothetical protein [Chlorobium limicola]
MGIRPTILFIIALVPGLLTGCGREDPKPAAGSAPSPTPVAVQSIVSIEKGSDASGAVLIVPKEAVFSKGPLTGVYVVDPSGRISERWIATGHASNGSLVVISGLDEGEKVVGRYRPELREGMIVE